jgi:hypothetical protein
MATVVAGHTVAIDSGYHLNPEGNLRNLCNLADLNWLSSAFICGLVSSFIRVYSCPLAVGFGSL